MISFITWCNNDKVYQGLLDTLPDDSEAIRVGQEFDSMAKAYNYGTTLAKGETLCYIHQDVRILDKRFPEIVEKALENINTGFVGPIGNIKKSKNTWWDNQANNRGWVLQDNFGTDVMLSFGAYSGYARQLDALMMCTKKKFKFPEELPGIHYLDLWMCAEAEAQGFTNGIFSCCIKHLSWGEMDRTKYEQNYELYRKKWL